MLCTAQLDREAGAQGLVDLNSALQHSRLPLWARSLLSTLAPASTDSEQAEPRCPVSLACLRGLLFSSPKTEKLQGCSFITFAGKRVTLTTCRECQGLEEGGPGRVPGSEPHLDPRTPETGFFLTLA